MSHTRLAWPLLLAVLLAAACERAESPTSPGTRPAASLTGDTLPQPLDCPTDVTLTGRAVIGPSGGTLRAGGHSVTIPAGALTETLTFTLSAPAGAPLRVDATADGLTHVQFKKAVQVVVDYGRCPASELAEGPLSAWYVEGLPPRLIKRMSGSEDPAAHAYRFYTDHFSGYVIAN